MRVRSETEADRYAIRAANEAAFGSPAEAELIEVLRGEPLQLISLVAEIDGEVVGHILFSPVTLPHHDVNVMGLGPMAVAPSRQRQGIGSALVQAGLARCKKVGCHAVVVVGHAEYYPRFGFVPACRYGLRSEYDVPADVFMVVELEAGALNEVSGIVRYHEAFPAV